MALSEFTPLIRSLDPPLWVVTASDGKNRGGLVATFVSQASIVESIPRMLAGIGKRHRTWELIEASGAFTVHLLSENRAHLDWADRFGLESGRSVDKFSGLSFHTGSTGSPILDEAVGWAECRVESRLDTGDRTVYLAEVVDAKAPATGPVLTVQGWMKNLSPARLTRLGELYAKDSEADAEAILVWRRARTVFETLPATSRIPEARPR